MDVDDKEHWGQNAVVPSSSSSMVSLEDASGRRDRTMSEQLDMIHSTVSAVSTALPQLRSAPRAIIKKSGSVSIGGSAGGSAESVGSTGSSFMETLLSIAENEDGITSKMVDTHLAHTPPNNLATSYESRHFGKRMRSGSISERILVSSDLEEKGMIDSEQKSVMKDLIISGDENLQEALDNYDDGDPSKLESIILSGSLSKERATSDIDLLGDLDLEFLSVHEGGQGSNSMFTPDSVGSEVVPLVTQSSTPRGESAPSDGIGDLEFDAGFESFRLRSDSILSMDNDPRTRSNSLFSALIDSNGTSEYGRWMEESATLPTISESGIRIAQMSRRASAPGRSNLSLRMAESAVDELFSDEVPNPLAASKPKKTNKDNKREKKEKKPKREKGKKTGDKKSEKDKASEEERPAHVPGSGLPRSLSDPNLRTSTDDDGLMEVERPDGWVGAYSPESRKKRIQRFSAKRGHRVWTKTVTYDVRKNFANSRLRVKGRFVKKEDETLMRELIGMT